MEEYMKLSVYVTVANTDNEYINFRLDSKLLVDRDQEANKMSCTLCYIPS
jgi:hypothetical protein